MAFIDKGKVLNGVGKAVDSANSAANKAENFIKENEIDRKVGSAMNKAENFVKDMEIDKKLTTAKSKAEHFIKDNEIDKAVSNVKNSMEDGIKKAGRSIEKGIDKFM